MRAMASLTKNNQLRSFNIMKHILYTGMLFVFLSTGLYAQDNTNLLSGRDPETYQRVARGTTCRVYTKYVVKTDPSAVGGENVDVFRNSTTGSGACLDDKDLIISLKGTYTEKNKWTDDEDVTSGFSGLSGKYLFIQKIVEPFVGAVEIFDLTTAKSVFKDEIYGKLNLVQARFMDYEKWSKKDGSLKNCPQAAKWKKSGLAVGWVQKHRLDLQTLKATDGALRCEAQQ